MSENGSLREECLYCHSDELGFANCPCPVCCAWKLPPKEVKEEEEDYFFWTKIDPDFLPAYP